MLKFASALEDFGKFIISNAGKIIGTFVAVGIFFLLLLIIKLSVKRFTKNNEGKRKKAILLIKLFYSVIKYILIILLIIIILSIWGVNVFPILVGVGILILAVALASQKLLGDYISGLCIIIENCYDIDDVVEINGFKGKVDEISLRTTKLINWKNEVRIIRNGKINEITNYSKAPSIGSVEVSIDKNENIDKIINLLEEKIQIIKERFPQIIEGPNVIGVTDINKESFNIRINVKTEIEKHHEVERELKKYIKELFDDGGINSAHNQVVEINGSNNK